MTVFVDNGPSSSDLDEGLDSALLLSSSLQSRLQRLSSRSPTLASPDRLRTGASPEKLARPVGNPHVSAHEWCSYNTYSAAVRALDRFSSSARSVIGS